VSKAELEDKVYFDSIYSVDILDRIKNPQYDVSIGRHTFFTGTAIYDDRKNQWQTLYHLGNRPLHFFFAYMTIFINEQSMVH